MRKIIAFLFLFVAAQSFNTKFVPTTSKLESQASLSVGSKGQLDSLIVKIKAIASENPEGFTVFFHHLSR